MQVLPHVLRIALGINAVGEHVHLTLRDLGGFDLVTSLAITTSIWKITPLELTLGACMCVY
jgi:hypothetical protein